MRYAVYVDGFNLYNRCLKDSPYRWLDLNALIQNLNLQPGHVVVIRYFSAHVINRPSNPGIAQRQQMYFRALHTLPEVKIHLGTFKLRDVKGELIDQHSQRPSGRIVTVSKYEEKGSDVNIASYMLADGFQNNYDVPILISNDSDLSAPLEIIKTIIKKPIGLISPDSFHMTELSKFASFKRRIKSEHLEKSLFPDILVDEHGPFSKPKGW